MKKRVLFFVLIITLLMIPQAFAQDEAELIKDAYECLDAKVAGKCSSISLEDQIFSLLALGECKSRVESSMSSSGCWPSTNCNLKTTSQAMMVLYKKGEDVDESADWLLSQKSTPPGMTWILQIDSNEETSCTVSSSKGDDTVRVKVDKKVELTSSGKCLKIYSTGYWFEILDSCEGELFTITCDKSFISNLLYKKEGSNTIFVSEDTNEGSSTNPTEEEVTSLCFGKAECDYEGSLWAALALSYTGNHNDVLPYIPYLVSNAEGNEKYFPEAFLDYLTTYPEYKLDIQNKQNSRTGLWERGNNGKLFDTALVLFLVNVDSSVYEKAKEGLLDELEEGQGGCWQGDIKNTGFILYTLWYDSNPFYCDYAGDCPDSEGYECVDHRCVELPECDDERPCDPGEICIGGYCVDDTKDCVTKDDCGTGEVCINNTCVLKQDCECDVDDDCFEDEYCNGCDCIQKKLDCEDEGYYCRSEIDCENDDGNILDEDDYECSGVKICCSVDEQLPTCAEEGGIICDVGEDCLGGTELFTISDDLEYGQSCCYGEFATCGTGTEFSECELEGGSCRSSCYSYEFESYDYDCDYNDACCFSESPGCTYDADCNTGEKCDNGICVKEGPSLLWIWILLALIVLVTIGILFRGKLRPFFFRISSMFGGKKPGPRRPPLPPSMPPMMRRPMPRRILTPSRPEPKHALRPSRPPGRPPVKPPARKPTPKPKDLDDVLKKLKEMGK